MADSLTLPLWYDLHVHLRQGPPMQNYVKSQLDMGCAGVLAMPNTKPPVAKVREQDEGDGWSIEGYRQMILDAGGDAFSEIIVPLYLTAATTPKMIADGARSGLLKACKYYPPHGTTNADFGRPLQTYIDNGVIAAMSDHGIILCLHGEEHGLGGEAYFGRDSNAEDYFYRERMPALRTQFPDLKIVCEHVTTETAVKFVQDSGSNTGATVTPQHLLYTVGDLVRGLPYHLYCLPVVKFEQDRAALRKAVNDPANSQFFAGTDSAPHTQKCTPCGCAAGCFTGGIAPQLYVHAFNLNEGQAKFEKFLCLNGPTFYNLPVPKKTFTMIREKTEIRSLETPEGPITPLPLGLNQTTLDWRVVVE